MRTFIRQSSLYDISGVYLSGIISFLAYFLLTASLSSQMAVPEFGYYNFCLKLTVMVSNLLVMGQPLAIRVFLSSAMRQSADTCARSLFNWASRQIVCLCIVCVIGFGLVQLSLIYRNLDTGLFYSLSYLILAIPFLAIVNLLPPILDVLHFFKLSRLTQHVLGHAIYCSILITAAFLGKIWSLKEMIILYIASQLIVIAAITLIVMPHISRILQRPVLIIPQPKNLYSRTAMLGWIANGSYQVITNLSILVVGLFISEPETLGHFSAVLTIVSFYSLLSDSLRGFLSQRLMELLRLSPKKAYELLMEALLLNAIGTLVVYLVGIYAQGPILRFFGEAFIDDLSILHTALTLNALLNIFQPIWSLVEYNQPGVHARLCMMWLMISVPLLLVMTAEYGILGTVIGEVMAEFLVIFGLLYQWSLIGRGIGAKFTEYLAEVAIND